MTAAGALPGKFRQIYGRAPEFAARAPGRIEFIGNHTDYNGGTVLGASIDRSVSVALTRRSDGIRRFRSDHTDEAVESPVGDMRKRSGPDSWINYPLGVLATLPEFKFRAPEGFDFLAVSDLPIGAGLSSSAAIELSSALAFAEAAGEKPARETLVKLCLRAENSFVGLPCGILDQGVSAFGRKHHLVHIDCRGPDFDTVPLPPGAHFWIFNTHTKHALVDGLYAERHRECMEAARELGVKLLADLSPRDLERKFEGGGIAATKEHVVARSVTRLRSASPRQASGTLHFQQEVRGAGLLADSPKMKRARHVIEEIARVEATVSSLRAGDLGEVGRLLTASHRSSQSLFQNSTAELDFLVDALVAQPRVYGARLTGGGFGGAVMAMTHGNFGQHEAETVAAAYALKFGAPPDILHTRTADGAELLNP